jgi:hypothetical protein
MGLVTKTVGIITLLALSSCMSSKQDFNNDPKIRYYAPTYQTSASYQNTIIHEKIKYHKTIAQNFENGVLRYTKINEYFYDELGNQIKEINFETDGKVYRIKHSHYDSLGQVILKYIEDVTTDTIYICTTIYYPDSSVETCIPNKNIASFRWEKPHYNKMTYDKNGRDSLLEYNIGGYGYDKIAGYRYNENNQLIERISYWSSGSIGNITKTLFYQKDSCFVYYHQTEKNIITEVCPGQTKRTYHFYADEEINVYHMPIQIQKGTRLELTFNEFGLASLWEYFDSKGELVGRITSMYEQY